MSGNPGAGTPKAGRRTSGSLSVLRDLAPKGKTSLKEFIEEKQPKTHQDYNVLSVYYVSQKLGIGPVALNHVFTCCKDMRWREPANLANSSADAS